MTELNRTSDAEAAAALRYYDTVDGDDAEAVTALFAENAVYTRPGYGEISGKADILQFYSQDRMIVSGRHAVTAIVCWGEHVAVEGVFSGQLRDGSSVQLGFADFFQFEKGLIARASYLLRRASGVNSRDGRGNADPLCWRPRECGPISG